MPLFSRSSGRESTKTKTHRFSLRKHHHLSHSDADRDAVSLLSSSHSSHSESKRTRRPTPLGNRTPEQTIVGSSQQQPPPTRAALASKSSHSSKLSSSTRSSASTLRSTSPTLQENLLLAEENDTEIVDESESPSPPSQHSRKLSMRDSQSQPSATTWQSSSRGSRKSLAEYRQLQCSMSYKNRVNSDAFRGTCTTATSSSSESTSSERMSDVRMSLVDTFRTTNTSVLSSSDGLSLLTARISESSTAITAAGPPPSVVSTLTSVSSPAAWSPEVSRASATSKMTEAGVAALQTRRAFQQMVLAMEDEDSGDEDESEHDAWHVTSHPEISSGVSGVLRLGVDEYRKFQLRLRQLEELAADQSRKQSDMERTIELEVQTRTRKVVEAMEKQISMYKQAKEFELEREVQRRVSEHVENSRWSRSLSRVSLARRSSTQNGHAGGSVGSFRDSHNIASSIKEEGTSLEKLLHPRRSRKRMEQMREREQAQKREMEQFREFIRVTEMRLTPVHGMESAMSATQLEVAKKKLDELADPLVPDSLVQSSPLELIELICVLRKNGREQDKQLEEAKSLVTAAIEAREDAETTAREAVELALLLDARLDHYAVREKQKGVVRQTDVLSAADEVRQLREVQGARTDPLTWQSGTPATSPLAG
uniref:Up-regulated during septation protein 1 domain-containing protein n=1 Tax=Peronospora matthiolae TaxID=2874970 RepID=A0AAV1UHI5_9STRA